MSARVQSSPFRETEFDQRLDRMLDDLKNTVTDDEDSRRTPLGIRSSSRSSSRAGSIGRRGVSVGSEGVADGGRLTHHRREYTSPDQSVKTVADTYQYDSGDTHPSGNFQKKVVKSTYSSYNVDGGLSSDLSSVRRGPSDREMERALSQESRNILNSSYTTTNNSSKVVDASQEVARELVGALSCIGSDSESEIPSLSTSNRTSASHQQQQQQQQQVSSRKVVSTSYRTTSSEQKDQDSRDNLDLIGSGMLDTTKSGTTDARTGIMDTSRTDTTRIGTTSYNIDSRRGIVDTTASNNDYSTLGRLRKNIRELDAMITQMDRDELEVLNRKVLGNAAAVKRLDDKKAFYSEGDINTCTALAVREANSKDGRSLSNGHFDDDMIVKDEKGGEVRRIVWRNRYEKTYETQDNAVPQVSIEKDAKNRHFNTSADINDISTISSLTRPHVPPQISPGGQSWADPVPLPTPPQQISPREPGVAYIYNYGSSGGSTVQPLPPLNYVSVAPPNGNGGAPSPTPSGTTTGQQPVIYHYSYHYTVQPGQALPGGAPAPQHPPNATSPPPPPALQIVPPPATGYSQSSNATTTNINKSNITEIHRTTNRDIHHHTSTSTTNPLYPGDQPRYPENQPRYPENQPRYPENQTRYPINDGGKPGSPNINYSITTTNYRTDTHDLPFPTSPADKGPKHPPSSRRSPSPPERHPSDINRNITINVNKTTTHTTRTSRDGEYPHGNGQPLTSTPYRGRSSSPDRRYPHDPRYPSGPNDSLDRVRRTPQPGLPFPDTSPLKPQEDARIPRKVDDLMTDFPERNGGPHRPGYPGHPDTEPLLSTMDESRQTRTEINVPPPERNEINTVSPTKIREEREKTKNLAGPPVYYPPGHEQFSETMHTMTLKEGGRRGKAKWRKEAASGYAESSSHSESKGGVKMVPVCLPLCCGAACTIM